MSGKIDNVIQVPSRCYRGLREITRKQRIKHNRTAGGSDDEDPRNDEEVMLARQRPWQAPRRASAEEGKDGPWSPRNLGNTRRLLRLARVISAPAAARCTFHPRVQAQLRKDPVLPPRHPA